jgi:outer membrane protein insertion porin family
MKKLTLAFLICLIPLILSAQELIEKIEILGNDKVTREAILYYLSSQEGDYFNPELLRRDFRVLWSTGFFANIRIEDSQGQNGKIVKIIVEENPTIRSITYKTGKKVKEDAITNKLKEKDEYIIQYSYYSPHKIQKIKATIEDLLFEKGLHAAKIDIETARRGKNEVDVVFKIDEGPKMRVGEVLFVGTPKLTESLLQEAMKDNKKHGLFSWVTGKDVYKQNKLVDDLALIKKRLQENGYMEATVGEPRLEEVTKRTVLFKKQKMMKIIVPVNAGFLYRVGEVTLEGNKSVSGKYLQSLIKLSKGDIYSTKVREKIVEKMGETYRDVGHLYAQIMPVESLDPKRKLVNLTFNIYEGEMCFLNRLEFRGNTYTKDKVIRREMLIREGDMFSFAYFKDSLLRIKQLGLVDLEKDPDVRPTSENPNLFDVTVNVKELQRNNIQFTAGYSGYEGTFVALSYSTVNFLGAGETFEVTLQHGNRIKNYVLGFSEPYFLDLPISLGFNVYNRYIILPYLYDRKGKGIDLTSGARIIGYWRANLTYSYEYVNITLPEDGLAIDPIYYAMFGLGNYHVSSIYPSIYRSTVDSPLTPSRGTMYRASLKYAGTFLGGEIHLVKPCLEFTHFQPIIKGHSLGFHIEYQFVKRLRNSEVPFWERFYLGGERNIRGYEIYTIGPRSEQGTNVGGEKSLVFNAEYIIAVGGPLYVIGFYDMGNAYAQDQKVSLKDMYTSAGLEARVFVPALRIPFRLIFAYNNRKIYSSDSNFAFRFAIGTTF